MANIRLKELVEADLDSYFTARSKETGRLVYFKTRQARADAIKAGTHLDPKAKKGDEPKAAAKPNSMFRGDYAKDRGGEAKPDGGLGWGPENDRTPVTQLPSKASKLTIDHSSVVMDVLNKELGIDGLADTDDNTGAIRYTASKGDEPTYTLYMGMNDDYGKPDEFRVSLESTYGNDPANLQGKHDKSFKSSKDAMTYMTALGKKYKKEMQMDDKEPKTSSKLTSMLPKSDSGDEPKKPAFGPGGTAGSFGDTTKDDFYNAGETLRQMGWKPDDIAKRIGDNLPYIDDEKDIPQIQDSDDKEDWINLYKKSIAMKKAGYSSSEIADKLRANL